MPDWRNKPRVHPERRLSKTLGVRFTESEITAIDKAARREKITRAEWIRLACVEALNSGSR